MTLSPYLLALVSLCFIVGLYFVIAMVMCYIFILVSCPGLHMASGIQMGYFRINMQIVVKRSFVHPELRLGVCFLNKRGSASVLNK